MSSFSFKLVVLKLQWASDPPDRLVTAQITASHPGVSVSVGLGWGLRIYSSNKYPGDANAGGTELHLIP